MKSFIVIVLFSLCACMCLSQTPYDLSRARHFRTLWRLPLGGTAFPIKFLPTVAGDTGLSVLVGSAMGRGRYTFRTSPRLDTTSIDKSLGLLPHAIDVDGVPPLEYLNLSGHVLQRVSVESALPLIVIDTVAGCAEEPQLSIDIDDDGYLDVITDIGGGGYTARVVMGGPLAGRGCERVLAIPIVKGRATNSTAAFYRSATGRWRLVQYERGAREFGEWIVLYDVTIERVDGKPTARFAKLDERRQSAEDEQAQPWGTVEAVVDTVIGRDWLLIAHVYAPNGGTSGPAVVERYDATEGTFAETGERVTGYAPLARSQWQINYALGTTRPVITMHASSSGTAFVYADDITHPFALWVPTGTGVQPVAGYAVINDQTGDGQPDMVVVGGYPESVMLLLTLDSAMTGVDPDVTSDTTLRYVHATGMLMITSEMDTQAHIDIVDLRGRVAASIGTYTIHAGTTHVDLRGSTFNLPSGMYLVRVATGSAVRTLGVMF